MASYRDERLADHLIAYDELVLRLENPLPRYEPLPRRSGGHSFGTGAQLGAARRIEDKRGRRHCAACARQEGDAFPLDRAGCFLPGA
jgi:hypothetical protein